jgi:hypothetical protein
MPVEFLSDQEAKAYGRYGPSVPQADLERFFYLDDADLALVAGLRGDHNRLGFSVQLATARFIGRFLAPLDGVPTEVVDYLAGQLQIADPSQVKKYAQRQQTHLDHAAKIRKALKLKDFAQVEPELAVYLGRRAWVSGDGPKAIFFDAVGWLRERDVLLPGGDHAGPAGGAGTGRRDAAVVGHVVRGADRSGTGGVGGVAGGTARSAGVTAGGVADRAGAGVGPADGQGIEPGRRDHRVGPVAGAAGCERDAAAAGRAGPVRDGRERGPAEAARR